MQAQSYEMEGMAQANTVLTRSNSTVMSQMVLMAQITVTMNVMEANLKALAYSQTNQARPKRNHYCWICRSYYTHKSKKCSSKKAVHQYEAHYKKQMGGSEKECE